MQFFFCISARSSILPQEDQIYFKDCADVYKSGRTKNGIYTIYVPNNRQPLKVSVDNNRLGLWGPQSLEMQCEGVKVVFGCPVAFY